MGGMGSIGEAQAQLEEQWDIPNGFFYRLRQGDYDPLGAQAVEKILLSVNVEGVAQLPRRFVSLTWWIPTFMEWQMDRVRKQGGDPEALERDIVRLENVFHKILGVP
jgi:hypothetical protein